MGALFGGFLSQNNRVVLVDTNAARVQSINRCGVVVRDGDRDRTFHPEAVTKTDGMAEADLILVFVKAMFTCAALEENKRIIGRNTYLMTLQNGVGHESKLLPYADPGRIIIGTTQHNSSVISDGHVHHGGAGKTYIGLLDGDSALLQPIADNFSACGFDCACSGDVERLIWNKLFLNTAASALTAALQVPLGFVLDDPYACGVMEMLAREAVAVANAERQGLFTEEAVIADIKAVLGNSRDGYTSIYSDIKNGARTEVDTISNAVVEKADRLGLDVPYHRMLVALIHALENKAKSAAG